MTIEATRASSASPAESVTGPPTLSAGGLCQYVSVLPSAIFSTPCEASPVDEADKADDGVRSPPKPAPPASTMQYEPPPMLSWPCGVCAQNERPSPVSTACAGQPTKPTRGPLCEM